LRSPITVREPAEKQRRHCRRAAKNADSDSAGCGIETFAQRDRHKMHGLKQSYAAGKSRREHHDHRTIAQVRKAASPTCAIPRGSCNIIRVPRAQPT
jgi:hypothetical protein